MAEDTSKQREEKHFQIKHLLHNCHVMESFWKRDRNWKALSVGRDNSLLSERLSRCLANADTENRPKSKY